MKSLGRQLVESLKPFRCLQFVTPFTDPLYVNQIQMDIVDIVSFTNDYTDEPIIKLPDCNMQSIA